jgi:hypothetical protein
MLVGMNPQDEPAPAAVDALRARLRTLAEASDLPVPQLTVDVPRREERLPQAREVDGERTVVVPPSLLEADPSRQLWEVAACLGRWASPVPQQRRRLSGIALALLVVAFVIVLIVWRAPYFWISALLLYPVGSWLLRWERRAMDDAGRAILTAAGHRPVEVARQAFADEPHPPGLKAVLSAEPSPSSRIRAAEADRRADPTV